MRLVFGVVIISFMSLFLGCSSEKKSTNESPSIENVVVKTQTKKPEFIEDAYEITDVASQSVKLLTSATEIKIAQATQPILLVNIFSTASSPSRGMIPYLNDLQKKYKEQLFVLGIPVNYNLSSEDLIEFMQKYDARYFISVSEQNRNIAANIMQYFGYKNKYPVPTTVLFKDGKYVTHYVGATPIEMIDKDIEQLTEEK